MPSSTFLLMKMFKWQPEGGVPTIEDIPAEEMDKP